MYLRSIWRKDILKVERTISRRECVMNITVKRNISYALLASVFALALLIGWGSGAPASYAKSVDDYTMIYDNFNPYTVYNDKTEDYRFGVVKNSELKLDAISLYHYNNGKGKKPGTISILKDGKEIGTWKCTGRYHDQYWDAFPNKILGEGNYTISCSSNSTWSWNGQAKVGFTQIYGIARYMPGIVSSISNFYGPTVIVDVKMIDGVQNYQIRYKVGKAKKWTKSPKNDGNIFEVKVKKGKTVKVQARYQGGNGYWGRWGKTKSFKTDKK